MISLLIAHDSPYLISILPKAVEIRTMDPLLMIQSIDLQRARYICQGKGLLYIASSNHVWRLNSMPISNQIRQLLQSKEFELALHLAVSFDSSSFWVVLSLVNILCFKM